MRGKAHGAKEKAVLRRGVAAVVVGVLLSCLVVGGLLYVNRERNERVFRDLIAEILTEAHEKQHSDALESIQKTQDMLEAVSAIYQTSDASPEGAWTNSYLEAVRRFDGLYDVSYFSADGLREILNADYPGPDREGIDRLLEGETVISDVFKQKSLGDVWVFSVSVPVKQGGAVVGAFRSVLQADLLIRSADLQAYEYTENYLLRGDGEVLLQADGKPEEAYTLQDALVEIGVSQEQIELVERALADGESQTIHVRGSGQRELFLNLSSLGYNGWLLLSLAYPGEFKGYAASISHNTVLLAVSLVAFLLLLAGSTAWLLMHQRAKVLHSRARYDLLAQFSDTILFEYDCQSKNMTFTPNIADRFQVPEDRSVYPFAQAEQFPPIHPDDMPALKDMLRQAMEYSQKPLPSITIRFQSRDGEYRWMQCQGQVLRNDGGKSLAVVGKVSDVHEQKSKEARLIRKSSVDAMTGALNREAAQNQIVELLNVGNGGFLFLLDVDNFKSINDTLGHAAGDRLLIRLVEELKKEFRQGDVVSRLGGDEFMVFMGNTDDVQAAQLRARRLLQRLKDDGEPGLTVSIGIAAYPADGVCYEELYHAADRAMYQAKRQGKNSYCFLSRCGCAAHKE